MKIAITLLGLLLASVASAEQADLTCNGSNGNKYNVYYQNYQQIYVYADDGDLLRVLDGLSVLKRGNMMSFIEESGHTVAVLTFSGASATGEIDQDQVTCQ